jgi:fructokinase
MSFKVIGIGEVLWDLLPSGPQLGGAPANFAFHAHQLGAEAQVITRIGNDVHGQRILQRFADMGIHADTVQVDDRLPTGIATVALGADGTPHFTIEEGVAWDALTVTDVALAAARAANAICFGSLAQRSTVSAAAIQKLVAALPLTALRVFDLNLRQSFYNRDILERSLQSANVLKLNDHELLVLTPMFDLAGDTRRKIEQLAGRFNLQLVALTRAERGSLLYESGNWSNMPGLQKHVVDTVGAGDAFTAALVIGMLHRFPLDDIHRIAAEVAAFVCGCQGATPILPAELRRRMKGSGSGTGPFTVVT